MAAHKDALIAGRYRLVERIAVGGMSSVWEAWDERLHRRVAVKQLHPQPGLSEADARLAADRAMREARITARLHHAHAVPVYDVVVDDGAPCLVMQYLESRSLQGLLAERGTLDVAEVARIGAEVASALAAAHRAGIVHRDVKPGNVLIDNEGSAKLTDFGISHALGDVTLTSTGMVTGTPAFLSPEAARGEPAGFPADVFALGATLYTALEGTPPVGDSDNPIALLHRVASGRLNPPTRNTPLSPLLVRMLAVDPAARPPMHLVADELAGIARRAAAHASAHTERMATPVVGPPGSAPPSDTVILPPAGRAQPPPAAPIGPPPRPIAPPERRRRDRGPLIAIGALVAALFVAGIVVLLASLADSPGSPQGAGESTASTQSAPSTQVSHTAPAGGNQPSHRSVASSSASSSSSSASTSSSATSTGAGAGQLAEAISSYYALLPDDTNDAWQRLTESYQDSAAGGRGNYEQFWNQFQDVTTSNVRTIGPSTVEASITYTYTSGKQTSEVRDFDLVEQDGIWKIDQSDVVG